MQHFRTYRDYLKNTFADRIARNPSYSLRAYARDLGLLPSHVSQIFSNKKSLSVSKSYDVAAKMGLSSTESECFALLVQIEQTKHPAERASLLARYHEISGRSEVTDLSVDVFKTISEWYHLPVLEMASIRNMSFTPKNVAKRLGISVVEAEQAIARLERLELIEKLPIRKNSKIVRYRKVKKNILFQSPLPNQALRRFHKQMLERAIASLESQTPQEKYVGSETFAIARSRFSSAQKVIEKFRRELVEYFDQDETRDEVYHLGIQLFRITKPTEEEK